MVWEPLQQTTFRRMQVIIAIEIIFTITSTIPLFIHLIIPKCSYYVQRPKTITFKYYKVLPYLIPSFAFSPSYSYYRAVVACLRMHGSDPLLSETCFTTMAHLCSNHEDHGREMERVQAHQEVGDLLVQTVYIINQ